MLQLHLSDRQYHCPGSLPTKVRIILEVLRYLDPANWEVTSFRWHECQCAMMPIYKQTQFAHLVCLLDGPHRCPHGLSFIGTHRSHRRVRGWSWRADHRQHFRPVSLHGIVQRSHRVHQALHDLLSRHVFQHIVLHAFGFRLPLLTVSGRIEFSVQVYIVWLLLLGGFQDDRREYGGLHIDAVGALVLCRTAAEFNVTTGKTRGELHNLGTIHKHTQIYTYSRYHDTVTSRDGKASRFTEPLWGNPMVISGFPSQRISDTELWKASRWT